MYVYVWKDLSKCVCVHRCFRSLNLRKWATHRISECLFSWVASQGTRTFRDIIASRKQQANHSIFVELPAGSSSQLYDVFASYGQVKKIFNWKNVTGKNFSLVEFSKVCDVKALLQKCSFQKPCDGLPTYSRFLYYKNMNMKSCGNNIISLNEPESQDLEIADIPPENEFVTEQVNSIYQKEKLNDIDIRLRFLLCTVLEDALKGIFPYCAFIPVGSTVTGFGDRRSDLNLFLTFNTKQDSGNSRFFHPTKKALNFYNSVNSQILCSVGDLLETFLPGVSDVKKNVLSTPSVVKFHHHVLGINCSFTANDMPSLFMSELLYICGNLDYRVRPLVLTVKQWAHEDKLTQSYRGPWITNFSLTLMVIFFLQIRPCPILPPLDKIQHQDVANNFREENDEAMDTLLKEFFYFLSSFKFGSKSISVNSAQALTKPDFSPLYIQNPMDQQSNLCANVTQKQLNNLTETASRTLWNLESISHYSLPKSSNLLELLLTSVKEASPVKC